MSRHDYLPFGEEVPVGLRNGIPGYATADNVRQKFTGYEHDSETGLEFAQARYYASIQGRFTGVDPISGRTTSPQTWNRYAYSGNNPLKFVDPSGMNYFVGGGVVDPHIGELQIDGFAVSPQETDSPKEQSASISSSSAQFDQFAISESSGSQDDADYGFVANAERNLGLWECWFEEFGFPLVYLGERGVASDITHAEIGYSMANVGQERDSTTQPFFGAWSGDERGHIIAKALGGAFIPGNLTSQSAIINRGPVKAFENSIRRTLSDHKDCSRCNTSCLTVRVI